ncbi:hypothetical protein YC2023_017779 [Brassica napus]
MESRRMSRKKRRGHGKPGLLGLVVKSLQLRERVGRWFLRRVTIPPQTKQQPTRLTSTNARYPLDCSIPKEFVHQFPRSATNS